MRFPKPLARPARNLLFAAAGVLAYSAAVADEQSLPPRAQWRASSRFTN